MTEHNRHTAIFTASCVELQTNIEIKYLHDSRFANSVGAMNLKPQDIVVLLKLMLLGPNNSQSFAALALALGISPSEVHAGVKRLANAKLYNEQTKRPVRKAALEFLIHGVKYAFPPKHGGLTLGYPTGYAAPPLDQFIQAGENPPPVWPSSHGTAKGLEFSPLYKSVPEAIKNDPELYKLLALLDAIRDGRARERVIAEKELRVRIENLAR